ncbi:gastric triacylglycerol lipase-like isoform X1 [Apis laboriosa]|uniref:gastric triacylglycerol lipase-like isoform X1 n=1 Tax=Apis laboriosa TaxID=183418 RepID=UPI001CC8268F|nr:gastric triacylglycerol lipase-like isoform X1 [Apis laboriosa]
MSSFYGLIVSQFLILNFLLAKTTHTSNRKLNFTLKTPELIKNHGYQVEIHNIVTEDGYILEIHRLPYGRINGERNFKNAKRPVLIQHGLAGSSADWILMGPERALAYMLADAGYDVWLGNNRGNIYSRNHISMLPTERYFWNFSYHELGIYDIPATIDYIIHQTNCKQIFYIGHSQGTTQFWVAMSQKPDYNAKIKLMIGLAPVAFTGNLRGPITKLAKLTYMGVMNLTSIMNHVPAGASWKQLVHFGQGYIYPDNFRQFDYGNDEKNYRIYNSVQPPKYELNKIIAPIALFSSNDDLLATKTDVNLLKNKLGNLIFHKEIFIKSFSHYDFLWGPSSISVIFKPILDLLVFYEQNPLHVLY